MQYILIQDRVDGEFSRYKDCLTFHMEKHNAELPDYIEVLNSETFVKFGEKYLSKPGPKSGIEMRKFFDLKENIVKDRIDAKPSFKTLSGINSMYQYICRSDGEVLWRKLPCFCEKCSNLEWKDCLNKDVVGKVKVVIKEGVEF